MIRGACPNPPDPGISRTERSVRPMIGTRSAVEMSDPPTECDVVRREPAAIVDLRLATALS